MIETWRNFYEGLFVVLCVTFDDKLTFTTNERWLKRDVISMRVYSLFCAWRLTRIWHLHPTTGDWNVTQLLTKKLSWKIRHVLGRVDIWTRTFREGSTFEWGVWSRDGKSPTQKNHKRPKMRRKIVKKNPPKLRQKLALICPKLVWDSVNQISISVFDFWVSSSLIIQGSITIDLDF